MVERSEEIMEKDLYYFSVDRLEVAEQCYLQWHQITVHGNLLSIVASFEGLPQNPLKPKKGCPFRSSKELSAFQRAFFDGAEQNGSCGCSFLIMVNENIHFSIHGNGKGSKSKVEAIVVAGLLKFCLFLDIQDVTVFGDSKVMMDFVSRKNHILMSHLAGWLDRIKFF